MAEDAIVEVLKKRRSSILKLKTTDYTDVSPPPSRRVSFAESMKIKTFNEAGYDTSEIVPADGSCEMSLVNTPAGCDANGTAMDTDISTSEKSTVVAASNGQQKTGCAVGKKTQQVTESTNMSISDSEDDDDDDDDDVTSDVLQVTTKVVNPMRSLDSTESESAEDNVTGNILKDLATGGGGKGNSSCKSAKSNKGANTKGAKNGHSAAPSLENGSVNPRIRAALTELEQFRKQRREMDERMEKLQEFAEEIHQETKDFVNSLENNTRVRPWK